MGEIESMTMMLGIYLNGKSKVVLVSLNDAQRRNYCALTTALAQSFSQKELVHLYQTELKSYRKRGNESMVDLGREIAKLVK